MPRLFFGGCYVSSRLVLALGCFGGLAMAGSISGGDAVWAQQAQPSAAKQKAPRPWFTFGSRSKQAQLEKKSVKTAAAKPAARLAVPKPETMLALIRLYLVGLDQAIKANDFRVLHAISSPVLKSKISPDQLAKAFADLRARRVDLAAVVIVTPEITQSPAVLPGNILNLVGHIPTQPLRIGFQMQFEPAGGQWRLRGMNVSAHQVRRAPSPQAAAAPAPKTKKKSTVKKSTKGKKKPRG